MPTSDLHMAQAAHNESLLALFREQALYKGYSDWYVTIAFYAAIHHIEATLYTLKRPMRDIVVKHSSDLRKALGQQSDHGVRRWILKQELCNIYDSYMDLYQLSQTAKYNCHIPSESDWSKTVSLLELMKAECEIARMGSK